MNRSALPLKRSAFKRKEGPTAPREAKPLPERRCVICDRPYTPSRPLQSVCSVKCSKKVPAANLRRRKEAIKSRSQWETECRAIVQAIARLRDRADGCISCGLPATWGGQWHGSHFRSHGACTALQFNLWNIHKACSPCNRDKGGNIHAYRPRLVAKIGQDRVDWLMAQNQVVKLPMEYYPRFKRVMGKRLRQLASAKQREELPA